MSCNSSELLFEGYLDGTLAPAQRARLLGHLKSCGSCKGVLDELRVVDALIAAPRHVELPENFTFATMAEVRSLPRPQVSTVPIYAYLVSFLVAGWLLIGAGFLLASSTMRGLGETALDMSASSALTAGVVVRSVTRVLGDLGAPIVGTAMVLDVSVALALIVGFAIVRPRLRARARS